MVDMYDVDGSVDYNEIDEGYSKIEPVDVADSEYSINDNDLNVDVSDLDDLKENTDNIQEFYENGYKFEVNDIGQVVRASGDLHLAEGKRDLYAQRNAGGDFRRDTDDGGHLIANRFEGPGGLENLVPEDRSINRGAYKTMENHWANELLEGNSVNLDVTPIYHGDSLRPDSILARTEITDGDKSTIDYFSVTNENLESKEFEIPENAEELFDSFPNAMND